MKEKFRPALSPIFVAFCVALAAVAAWADATRRTAPNAAQVTTAAMNGMDATFEVKNSADTEAGEDSGSVDTSTPIALLNDDLTADQQQAKFQQNIMVHNFDTSAKLCIIAISDHTSGSCASASGSCFADGETNKALIVPAGSSRSLRFGGDVRLCLLATTAGIDWQAERYLTLGK